MKRAGVVLLVLLGVLVNAALAQKPAVVTDNDPGWHRIGQITASFKMENESIIVYGRDEFAAIRLKVTDAPIKIEHVQLFYEDGGDMQKVDVHSELLAGAETRVINLRGANQDLEKVVFTYKTLPNHKGEKATVELWGLKTRKDGSDALRNDESDHHHHDDSKLENDAKETREDINEEAREARDEVKEESREARQEAKEAREEVKEETREAKEELKEERREAKEDSKDTESDLEEGAEKLGDEISETAASGAAHIQDKVYVDKMGPDGQSIFINKHSKYYYINDEGKKVFVSKWQLKDKPKKD